MDLTNHRLGFGGLYGNSVFIAASEPTRQIAVIWREFAGIHVAALSAKSLRHAMG